MENIADDVGMCRIRKERGEARICACVFVHVCVLEQGEIMSWGLHSPTTLKDFLS